MPTLETLVVGQFVHYFVVFCYIERFEAAGAEHEMGNAVQGITVKQRLRRLEFFLMLDAIVLDNSRKHPHSFGQPRHT